MTGLQCARIVIGVGSIGTLYKIQRTFLGREKCLGNRV